MSSTFERSPSLSTIARPPATATRSSERPMPPPPRPLGRLAQGAGGVAQRVGRLLQFLLELAILEQRPGCGLAVAHAAVCVAGRAVCRQQARAQLLVRYE